MTQEKLSIHACVGANAGLNAKSVCGVQARAVFGKLRSQDLPNVFFKFLKLSPVNSSGMGRMKTTNAFSQKVAALATFFMLTTAALRAGQYFQDFSGASVGATSFGDGSQLFATPVGVASVQDAIFKELRLTANGTGNSRSAFLLPDLDAGNHVAAFRPSGTRQSTAIFRMRRTDSHSASANWRR